jgi:hypothetical protein
MMRLASGAGGPSLAPTLVGYQFDGSHLVMLRPAAAGGDWDRNWLVVRGEAHTDRGQRWAFADPCLLTWEAVWLERWLRDLAAGADVPDLDFTEPNLAFRALGRNGGVEVRVELSHESAPAGEKNVTLAVLLTRPELAGAAERWAGELARYPRRA